MRFRSAGLLGWSAKVWVGAVLAAMAFGWVVATALGVLGGERRVSEPEPDTVVGVSEPIPIPGPTDPLLAAGRVVSHDEAEAAVPYPITLPSDKLASESSLTEVWVREDTGEVALRFSTGVRIYLAEWPKGKDPASSFETQLADSGAGSIQEAAGHPAWVLEKDAQKEGFPPQANLTIVVGGVETNIWGDVSTADLLRIAESIVKAT